MEVCLIRPSRVIKLLSKTQRAAPPLGLAYISSALSEAGYDVSAVDAVAEGPNSYFHFDADLHVNGLTISETVKKVNNGTRVIGLNCMFTGNWLYDIQLINSLKNEFPKSFIVAGGEHVSAIPEVCLKQAEGLDAIVIGEGEETIVELLNALKEEIPLESVKGIAFKNSGGIIINEKRLRKKNIDDLPWPGWDKFPVEIYKDSNMIGGVKRGYSLPIMATRGCPFTCTFCSSPLMWGTSYIMRNAKDVVDEMEYLKRHYGITNFEFYDLTAITKKKWTMEFTRELKARKLDITWQIPAGTRSEAIDEEVAKELAATGCKNLTYAPESGSEKILKAVKKKANLNYMLASMKEAVKSGVNVKTNIIIGFPDETHTDIWKTMWFIVKSSWVGIHDMCPSVFQPYPGTELFDRLLKENTIDLNSNAYYAGIIYSDTFLKSVFYNNKLSEKWIRFYVILSLLLFYSTNFLFRPTRLFYTLKNIATKNYESKGEMALGELFTRMTKVVRPRNS